MMFHRAVVLLLGLLPLAACREAATPGPVGREPPPARRPATRFSPDESAAAARVGDATITVDQVAAAARASGKTPAQALDDLIRLELLATEARAHGTFDDPLVSETARRALVSRFVAGEIEPRLARQAVPASELRAVYEKYKTLFVRPRYVRVELIGVMAGSLMKPAPRAQRESIAREMSATVDKHGPLADGDLKAISQLPAFGGKVYRREAVLGPDDPEFPNLRDAALKLKRAGERTPLIIDPGGFSIARYLGEEPAKNVPFEQAVDEILDHTHADWQRKRFVTLADELRSKWRAETWPGHLAAGDRTADER